MSGFLIEFFFNSLLESLLPLEFDGRAHIRLPETDQRLQLGSLLRWELHNVLAALRELHDVRTCYCPRLTLPATDPPALRPQVLKPLERVLMLSDARDKAARLVQFALATAVGVLAAVPQSLVRRDLVATLGSLEEALADARRTFRWLAGAPQLLTLMEGPPTTEQAASEPRSHRALAAANRLLLLAFLSFDHLRWLQQHGLAAGPSSRAARLSMKLLAASYGCGLILNLSQANMTAEARRRLTQLRTWLHGQLTSLMAHLMARVREARSGDTAAPSSSWSGMGGLAPLIAAHSTPQPTPQSTPQIDTPARSISLGSPFEAGREDAADAQAFRAHMVEAGRQLMLLTQAARRGGSLRTNDALVGLLGVITSSLDLRAIWLSCANRQDAAVGPHSGRPWAL